ncbi:chaperone protein DNAj [Perkinsela sp. CCAP 1560/4]|nr:chaperone protein DNAj [Perkinsela sp. CCAP 1560/4]|eukprot:KNH07653.1 chaperone protein DNAj [Perkinsela sp. CCAP 1560/4]
MRCSAIFLNKSIGKEGVPITKAFGIFGFRMNEEIKPEILKKRYKALVLQHHPDHGGNAAKFQLVQRSYRLLKKYDASKEKVPPEFERIGLDEGRGFVREANSSFDFADILIILTIVSFFWVSVRERQERLLKLCSGRSCGGLDEIDSPEHLQQSKSSWHIWRRAEKPETDGV